MYYILYTVIMTRLISWVTKVTDEMQYVLLCQTDTFDFLGDESDRRDAVCSRLSDRQVDRSFPILGRRNRGNMKSRRRGSS